MVFLGMDIALGKITIQTYQMFLRRKIMLLDQYKESGFLFNVNLTGKSELGDIYRGDLVLELGGKTERGDLKPPAVVAKQGVLLLIDDKIALIAGGLEQLSDLSMVADNFADDMADDCISVFFAHDIKKPMIVSLKEKNYILVPLDDGMIWNELLELLCIEKSDLKGQSAEEKVVTLYKELGNFKQNYPNVKFEEALGLTVQATKAARGAV